MKKLKILLLADSSSIHTQRWANSLSESGVEIAIFSLCESVGHYHQEIEIYTNGFDSKWTNRNNNIFSKIIYLKTIRNLRKVIKEFKPDILHAHFATSYGLLGALSRFKPFIISVWGSDIFEFPRRTLINNIVLRFNLLFPKCILSTSHIMAIETSKYTKKKILVTPFGVDISKFMQKSNYNKNSTIVFGTIKTLDPVYGIDTLIKAFNISHNKLLSKNINSELHIIGGGPEELKLKKLAEDLNINNQIFFKGKIPHEEVPQQLQNFDIFVALSNSESYGVAIVEASSCSLPVIVSNVGGLPEVVVNNETGFIIEPSNPEEAAAKMFELGIDKEKRETFGKQGRHFVEENYNWETNVKQMIEIYNNSIINGY
ncbi:glycosyltransferase [Aquipluma nitroreducens]|uniref:Glycosyltransferase n=1 Tax=Aquipluma nitroreducens TaxID=2010828 RepID=A0A5K7SBQ1_9BACT|nr:glycosyltransferase [Aquipluma nitroreducens]BBE18886.1 glycosyltransferase [Aquipluma nitroreducens]